MILDRRQFLQFSSASLFFADRLLHAEKSLPAKIRDTGKIISVKANNYSWEWSPDTDIFRLRDKEGRTITEGFLQPAILVKMPGNEQPLCSAGKFSGKTITGDRLSISYGGINGDSKVQVAWRFAEENLWFEPIVYEASSTSDVISVHYFAKAKGEKAEPSLRYSYLVQPGLNMSTAISPVVSSASGLETTTWLGHGGAGIEGVNQQWALPSHYFCGVLSESLINAQGSLKEHLSDAFCCGLAEIPSQDFLLHINSAAANSGTCSPVLNVRSDVWGHAKGPGVLTFGATMYWAIGRDYREAIRQYYDGLVRDRIIRKKENSVAKNATVTASAFDTWGAQVAAGKRHYHFDEKFLDSVYAGLNAAGMESKIFIMDDKWEGKYGMLEHSEATFPNFETFLTQLRSDGHKVGLWAAFLRCEDPQSVGLNLSHMIRGLDGKPITGSREGRNYYLYDVSQSEVQVVLSRLVKRFMRRYKPDLIKFDFGYEIPSLSAGAPKNMALAGEGLFMKGVEVVVSALRDENPDVAVMYYSLSPLFIDYFDLHSPDDMFECVEDYALEANRRFFFSSLLGEIGMPTYGSGGYDWASAPSIWFDSAVVGSIGSLAAFTKDEQNATATPEMVAKYNGLAQITRTSNIFTVEPLDPVQVGSLSGAHSSSWVRIENGKPVLVALRKCGLISGENGHDHYQDIVQCNTSVVVASKTDSGIGESNRIGIVSYGDGEVTIRRQDEHAVANITTHLFGGTSQNHQISVTNGQLTVPLRDRLNLGLIIERVEVEFK